VLTSRYYYASIPLVSSSSAIRHPGQGLSWYPKSRESLASRDLCNPLSVLLISHKFGMSNAVEAVSTSLASKKELIHRHGALQAPFTDKGGLPSNPTSSIQRQNLDLSEEYTDRSDVAQLWLRSRLLLSGESPKGKKIANVYRQQGEHRPLSISNIHLALQLVSLLWSDFLGLFWQGNRSRVTAFLARRLIKGVLPAAK